jgi:hypothetical protein
LEELEIVDSNEENVQDIQNEEKLKENTTQEMDELVRVFINFKATFLFLVDKCIFVDIENKW